MKKKIYHELCEIRKELSLIRAILESKNGKNKQEIPFFKGKKTICNKPIVDLGEPMKGS